MRKTSYSQILSSLDVGSKNRLEQYCLRLETGYDRRNYDYDANRLFRRYLKGVWKREYRRTKKYLEKLVSKTDGKAYSQGVMDPEKLLDAARRFAEANHPYFGWNEHYKQAFRIVLADFKGKRLRPLRYDSDDSIKEALPRMDTHAGFTFILSGEKEKGKNLDNINERFHRECDEAIANGSFNKPVLVAVRTQGNGHAFTEDGEFTNDCDHKTRMVSMIDLIQIIAELIFAKPIQALMAGVTWYAGGKPIDEGVGAIVSNIHNKCNYWISLDYSSYDSSISAWLIHDAFAIMKTAFEGLTEREEKLFAIIENDFIEKNFVLGHEVIHSVKGVPSGSMFTQIVDTIVNRLMILTYLVSQKLDGLMTIMGDDNLLGTMVQIDPYHLSTYLLKNFGVKVNPDKTKMGDKGQDPAFLSCVWTSAGRTREPHEIIAKLLYPERKRIYGEGRAKPEEVVYSYYLAYTNTVSQMLDLERFFTEYPQLAYKTLRDIGSRYLPGFIQYTIRYTGGYWDSGR